MLLDKFSRVIGETTPESVRCRGGRDSIDHGPGSHDDVANAVAGVLLRNVGNPLDAESLAAPWQDAPETPGRFETVYRRPRNLDHEFSGWADEKTYPEHTENWDSRGRMNMSERLLAAIMHDAGHFSDELSERALAIRPAGSV
jgi:hypothetical protein